MLNIIAGTLSTGAPPVSPNSYESIATVNVGSGGAGTVSFTSIPSTFTHLQLRGIAKQTGGSQQASFTLQINGDTGANYAWHGLYGISSVTATASVSDNLYREINFMTSTDTLDNAYSVFVMDFLDYASTNKNKTLRSLGGCNYNTNGGIHLQSGLWMNNTTAISSLTFTPGAGNFNQYSQFALYGIKGS